MLPAITIYKQLKRNNYEILTSSHKRCLCKGNARKSNMEMWLKVNFNDKSSNFALVFIHPTRSIKKGNPLNMKVYFNFFNEISAF